jgi:excisionase family DNA binding protein
MCFFEPASHLPVTYQGSTCHLPVAYRGSTSLCLLCSQCGQAYSSPSVEYIDAWRDEKRSQQENEEYLHLARTERTREMNQPHHSPTGPLLLTIAQVAAVLNLGKTKVYELIYQEHLPIHKFGRATRVSPTELQQWLQERNQRQ